MEDQNLSPKEAVSANQKLKIQDAVNLLEQASQVVISKGKKSETYKVKDFSKLEELAEKMLGPTGNLRAPLIKKGKKLFVGYNEEAYHDQL